MSGISRPSTNPNHTQTGRSPICKNIGMAPKRCIGKRDAEVSQTPVCRRIFSIHFFWKRILNEDIGWGSSFQHRGKWLIIGQLDGPSNSSFAISLLEEGYCGV